jgi:hypothetical protein
MPIFILVVLIFFLTRFYHLGTQSFWIDELVSMHFSAHTDWKALLWDNHPPLYHLLLKGWLALFGTSEFAARSLSVLFSLISFTLLYRFILKRWGTVSALYGAVLFILSSLALLYAQEARMYALFEMAATLNLICFWQVFENQPRTWRNYLFSGLFLACTHYLALIPLSLQGLYFLWQRNYRSVAIRSFASIVFLVGLALIFGFHTVSLEWQRLRFETGSITLQNWNDLTVIFNRNFGCIIIFLIFCVVGLFRKNLSSQVRFLILFTLGSLMLFYIGQFFSSRYLFYPRYLIFLNSYIILILISSWPWSRMASLAFVILAGFSFSKNYETTKAPWREAAQIIHENGGGKVFTTRTLAIQTPYLTQAHAEAVKLESSSSFLLQISQQAELEAVWILDNYWGGISYIEPLKQDLQSQGYLLKDFSLQGGSGDSLTLWQVTKAPHQ